MASINSATNVFEEEMRANVSFFYHQGPGRPHFYEANMLYLLCRPRIFDLNVFVYWLPDRLDIMQ